MRDYIKMFTHNGLFHADDVFAAAMLSLMCDDYEVVRGGDEEIPSNEDGSWIVFDIGGGELDHHTPECLEANGTHPGTEVPYAAWRPGVEEVLSGDPGGTGLPAAFCGAGIPEESSLLLCLALMRRTTGLIR